MNKIQIETAQNVQIYQIPAGLAVRILAFILDILLIVVYEIILVYFLESVFSGKYSDGAELYMVSLLFAAPIFLYNLSMETFNNGQSLGKMVFRIRVVSMDGTPPRFSNYLIRWLMRLLDIALSTGALACLVIIFNGKGQRLGDIAAKTTVVSENHKFELEDQALSEMHEKYKPVYSQVTVLSDAEIEKIKSLYQTALKSKNEKMMTNLAKKVSEIIQVNPTESPADFVHRVILDYTFYTQEV